MASTYDSLLRLELQATGENTSTWGEKTNTNLELLANSIAGYTSISVAGSGTYALTTSNGATDEARQAFLRFTGLLTGNRTITVPSSSKLYVVRNSTTGSYSLTVKTASGTGVAVPQGYVLLIACDGTDCFDASEVARVAKAGDTMTGALVLPGNPTLALQAAPKQYVDALLPSGTSMLFVQTAAPTGWTKSTTHNNKALRVVSGTAGSGGTVPFTTAFASQSVAGSVSGTVAGHTLTVNEIPPHSHPVSTSFTWLNLDYGTFYGNWNSGSGLGALYSGIDVGNTGGGQAHDHSWSGTFTGTAINLAVQYVDVIVATKD